MAELKRIRVRSASPRDVGLFRKLWTALLEAQAKQGSVRDPKDLSLYDVLFNAYLEQRLSGIVLFVADKGVLMWGEHGPGISYQEKTLTAWGDYSSGTPEIKAALLSRAEEWAKSKEYITVLSDVYGNAEVPNGYTEIGKMLRKRL